MRSTLAKTKGLDQRYTFNTGNSQVKTVWFSSAFRLSGSWPHPMATCYNLISQLRVDLHQHNTYEWLIRYNVFNRRHESHLFIECFLTEHTDAFFNHYRHFTLHLLQVRLQTPTKYRPVSTVLWALHAHTHTHTHTHTGLPSTTTQVRHWCSYGMTW